MLRAMTENKQFMRRYKCSVQYASMADSSSAASASLCRLINIQ